MKRFFFFLSILFLLASVQCSKEIIDEEAPEIDLSYPDIFPGYCENIVLGNTYNIRLLLRDNVELDRFSIEIFQNFNGNTITPGSELCESDTLKAPIYPFYYLNTFKIPPGKTEFVTSSVIWFPEQDCCLTYFDEGDYIFLIRLYDKKDHSIEAKINIKLLKPE